MPPLERQSRRFSRAIRQGHLVIAVFPIKLEVTARVGPLIDSCHQGKSAFLTRDETLGKWMEANFVKGLVRVDGQPHACATCHGEPFNGDVFGTWAKK